MKIAAATNGCAVCELAHHGEYQIVWHGLSAKVGLKHGWSLPAKCQCGGHAVGSVRVLPPSELEFYAAGVTITLSPGEFHETFAQAVIGS
jgi:hypothetical protein